MNICIEAHALNHHRRSGMLTYAEGLINGLSLSDDVNRYYLSFYSLSRNASEMPGPQKDNFEKVVFRLPDLEFTGKQFMIDSICYPLFFMKKRINVFHRTMGYWLPSKKTVFKVLTVHDLRTLTMKDQFWAQNVSRYRKTIEQANICTVVSECTKKDLIQYFGIKEDKIRVTHLAADSRYKPASEDEILTVKKKYKIGGSYLLSIGSVPRKNIDGIIKAYAKSNYINSHQLVLTTNIKVEYYRDMISDLGLVGRALILDQLLDDDIVALYSGCHCFIFPSHYEGFGLPILEAFNCGAPVITSKTSACPEVAGDAALMVDPANIGEITEAINQICKNTELRNDFINKGFVRAKSFSWKKHAQEVLKVYSMA